MDCVVNEKELVEKAAIFSRMLEYPSVIFLSGDLGAGKTTFVRALLRALGVSVSVKSPTFTLVETYDSNIGEVQHFDLYRLEDPQELEYIGFRDLLETASLVAIEWPDKGGSVIGLPHWVVDLSHRDDQRHLSITRTHS